MIGCNERDTVTSVLFLPKMSALHLIILQHNYPGTFTSIKVIKVRRD